MAFLHKGKFIKSVSFLGFGRSNRAVYEYLTKRYPDLRFTIRTTGGASLPSGARVFESNKLFEDFSEDIVFVSPSVRRDKKEFIGKLLSSDAELFFEKNERELFAVTGSDGKSTTTSLAKSLLGNNAYAIGNIGVPFTYALDYPNDALLAAELSSFQLMDFAPKSKRAIITNITPNHLDWHKSMEEYISAKENVLKNTGEPVFFIDDATTREIQKKHSAFAIASAKLSQSEIKKLRAQTYVYIDNGAICANGERLLEISDIFRKEEYNLKNFLSAIALCYGFFEKQELRRIAKSFLGLPHRFEPVLALDGIKIFNSSIDSSPQRTLSTLTSHNSPCVLLMGGRTKMKNFEILRDLVEKNAHALVLTGENRYEIHDSLMPISTPTYIEEDFDAAVSRAFDLAKGNCDLIFSPASVSFDAFENFEKRGEAFITAIKNRTFNERFKI